MCAEAHRYYSVINVINHSFTVVFPLSAGQLYGLEKFWAFLKYSKIKNQPIEPKLQEHLSQFKNLEDFRVVVSLSSSSSVLSKWRELTSEDCQDSVDIPGE